MFSLLSLLSHGFFPKELPPAFNTEQFALFADGNRNVIDALGDRTSTRAATHNLARHGRLRRKLSIPNPWNQYHIVKCVETNESNFLSHFVSSLSASNPMVGTGERAVQPECSWNELLLRKARARATSKYLLVADISRCYHSIYTHSIPWAIHGKVASKANRGTSLWANELDRHVRNAQDGQTLGIPIGPDTSFIIAEAILTAIEGRFATQKLKGYRHYDDYQLGFATLSQAEDFFARLQESLNEYELALNPSKTKVLELPCNIESHWVPLLRSSIFRIGSKSTRTDIVKYFDLVFDMHRKYDDENVIGYAISRVKKIIPDDTETQGLLVSLLLQSCIAQPSVLKMVMIILLSIKNRGYNLDDAQISDAFNLIIRSHSLLGHGSEVAWALWSLITLHLPIDDSAADVAAKLGDSIVSLLLLNARSKGLIATTVDFSTIETYMTEAELEGEKWMVAYEADLKGWLPSLDLQNHVDNHKFFSLLKKAGVSFYDESRGLVVSASSISPLEIASGFSVQ